MASFSLSKALSTEYCSTTESESGWTNYIGDSWADDGTESDDSMTSDARSSSPPPRFHRYHQHSNDDQVQDKLRGQAATSEKRKQFQKQVTEKSMKHPCNIVLNMNKQANHDDDDQEEEDGEQLIRYQQSYRRTVGSTTDA